MKAERTLILISVVLISWTFSVTGLVGCFASRSKHIDDSANDGGHDDTDASENDGGGDGIDTPDPVGGGGVDRPDPTGGGGGVDRPDPTGGSGGVDRPDLVGGSGGIVTPEPVGGGGGIKPPEPVGGGGGIEPPEPIGGSGGIRFDDPETDTTQLIESEWTAGDFFDRYDRSWFSIDVVSGNIYHIYIDDEYGSGLHYADEEIYLYEGMPSDLRAYIDHEDVYNDDNEDNLVGFLEKPYDYKATFTGELYILLVSDNPGYQTFEIRFEVN